MSIYGDVYKNTLKEGGKTNVKPKVKLWDGVSLGQLLENDKAPEIEKLKTPEISSTGLYGSYQGQLNDASGRADLTKAINRNSAKTQSAQMFGESGYDAGSSFGQKIQGAGMQQASQANLQADQGVADLRRALVSDQKADFTQQASMAPTDKGKNYLLGALNRGEDVGTMAGGMIDDSGEVIDQFKDMTPAEVQIQGMIDQGYDAELAKQSVLGQSQAENDTFVSTAQVNEAMRSGDISNLTSPQISNLTASQLDSLSPQQLSEAYKKSPTMYDDVKKTIVLTTELKDVNVGDVIDYKGIPIKITSPTKVKDSFWAPNDSVTISGINLATGEPFETKRHFASGKEI